MSDVRPGEKFRVRADEWNAMRYAAKGNFHFGGFGATRGVGPGIVLVRNGTDIPLPQFSAVQFLGSCNPLDSTEFRSDTPIPGCELIDDPTVPFAILCQPLKPGEAGLARYDGFMACRLKLNEGRGTKQRAMTVAGETYLTLSDVGSVWVVDQQPRIQAIDGLVWALILVGYPLESAPDIYKAVVFESPGENDPAGFYKVDLYPAGLDSVGTPNDAELLLTDVCQGAKLPTGTTLLAHRLAVREIPDRGN